MRLRLFGCVALLFTGVAQADDGVPALLQFAEQYQRQSTGPKSENAAPADHASGQKSVSRRSARRTPNSRLHRPKLLR
ncbi:hypothetical protein PTR44_04870 [Serratia nevei]